MPISMNLSDDQTHIVYIFKEPFTLKELLDAYKEEKALRDRTPTILHSIVDMSDVRFIPRQWMTAKAGPGFVHPRRGQILMVGISHGLKVIIKTLMRVMRYDRVKFFDTRTEAEAFMTQILSIEQD